MKKGKKKPAVTRETARKITEITEEISGIWNGYTGDGVETDVLGSYTGTPKDSTAQPVQDADDL